MKKNKTLLLIGALVAVILLAVASIIVIPRLTSTTETVAPTAPESQPQAAAGGPWSKTGDCKASFTIAGPLVTPTPTPTLVPACGTTCQSDSDCPSDMSCNADKVCRKTACLEASDCNCPGTPTPTLLAGCSESCNTNDDCTAGLACIGGMCRNQACSEKTDCTCVIAGGSTPTPTSPQLPSAGFGLPTIGVLGGGVVMILLGILLAL